MDWIYLPVWPHTGISIVWKAILQIIPSVKVGLAWIINDGNQVHISMDPWIRGGNKYQLPPDLIHHPHQRDIKVVAQLADGEHNNLFEQAWFLAHNFGIPIQWYQTWEGYLTALSEAHVCIKEGPNELVWAPAEHGKYTSKIGYLSLLSDQKPETVQEWWRQLWKLKAPPRTCPFMWSVLSNRIPMGDFLIHISIYGPHWCVMCKQDFETNEHLFLQYPTVSQLWQLAAQSLSIQERWQGPSIPHVWNSWFVAHHGTKKLCLPLLLC